MSRHHRGAVPLDGLKRPDFARNVGADGRCGSCGGQTPIVGISRAEYEAIRREAALAAARHFARQHGPLRSPISPNGR